MCSVETPDVQDVMTCQPTQDLFFPLFLGSESGMPCKSCWLPRGLEVNTTHTTVNT